MNYFTIITGAFTNRNMQIKNASDHLEDLRNRLQLVVNRGKYK